MGADIRPPRYVQVGEVPAKSSYKVRSSGGPRVWMVPVLRDMRDRNRADADKYFHRPKGKR